MDADDILDFNFPTTTDINKVIVLSTEFKEIFNDLDSSSDCVEFFLSSESPYFVISTFGLCGECQVSINITSKETIIFYNTVIFLGIYFYIF